MKIILLMLFVIAIFGFTEIVFSDTLLNIGHIEWFTQNFHNSKIPVHKIQVTDSDMNRNPDELDKFTVNVWSDSDPAGISVLVYETEKNSGIFDTLVYFSGEQSTGQRLHTLKGDVVTAEYKDHTLPPPYTIEDELKIIDTLAISFPDESSDSSFKIDDPSFTRQNLLRHETIPNTHVILIIEGLGASLIVLFIIIYAIKKKMQK